MADHGPDLREQLSLRAGKKKAVRDTYSHTIGVGAHGAVTSHHNYYLDLDPTYRDSYGRPLIRGSLHDPRSHHLPG